MKNIELYFLATSLLSAAIGFMACAVCISHRIRRANLEGYMECIRHIKNQSRL